MIVIEVLGTPAPKGSARAFINKRTGRAILAPSGSGANKDRLRSWDALVREAAQRAVADHAAALDPPAPVFVNRAIAVSITFRLARPSGHWGKGKRAGQLLPSAPVAPRMKPDADKLARATLDSLHGAVFDDDSRIVDLLVRKRYAAPGNEGAVIAIQEWSGSDPAFRDPALAVAPAPAPAPALVTVDDLGEVTAAVQAHLRSEVAGFAGRKLAPGEWVELESRVEKAVATAPLPGHLSVRAYEISADGHIHIELADKRTAATSALTVRW